MNQGVTSIGIKAINGVVLASELKTTSSLIIKKLNPKIQAITPNIGMVYSGLGADYRVLVDKARKLSHTNHKLIYNEYPPVKSLVQDVAKVMQESTQSGGTRPFGVSLLVGGYDPEIDSYKLYQVDPSGCHYSWKATALGKGSNNSKTFLQKRWNEDLELDDAIHIALLALKDCVDGELTGENLDIAVITKPKSFSLGSGDKHADAPRFIKLSVNEINDRLESL